MATVTSGGVLHANGPGTAVLTARWDGWVQEEMEVTVAGHEPAGILVQDDFDTPLDPGRWLQVGSPPSRVVGSYLLMPGDALYLDGIVTREAVALPRGGTLEAEFRLDLTRRDKQWFRICLLEGELPEDPESGFEHGEIHRIQDPCIRYPNGQFSEFREGHVRLTAVRGFPYQHVDAQPHLPSDDWRHVALQLRADGELTLLVEREPVATAPVRVDNSEGTRWHVLLIGAAWETELHVRNLRLWDGPRYEEE